MEAFDRVFDRFFGLRAVVDEEAGHGHGHAHDDLTDEGELEKFTLSEEPGDTPEQGHSHGKPDDIKEFFKQEDMAQQYNLHQEANKIDIAALTDEIVLSNEKTDEAGETARVQLVDQPDAQPGRPRRPGQGPRPAARHRAHGRRGDDAARAGSTRRCPRRATSTTRSSAPPGRAARAAGTAAGGAAGARSSSTSSG